MNGQMITHLRSRRPHPAAVDAPDPGDDGGPGAAQRTERDVRRRDGLQHGLKLEDIRHGLRTFDTTFFQAPGRMNVFDEHPFKVILDYGHNPAAVEPCASWSSGSTCAAGGSWC